MPELAISLSGAQPRGGLSRARWATRAQFLNLGVVVGAWGVHVPTVKRHYAINEQTLALVLLCTTAGSLLTLPFAGRIVGTVGARRTASLAGIGFCCALALTLTMPGLWALLLVMLCFGASESLFDVAINDEGTTLETLSGRTVMSGFHGMFSLGALLGSACTAVMLRLDVPPLLQLVSVGLLVAISVQLSGRGMLAVHPAVGVSQAHFAWPTGRLLLIGVLICSGMLAEGVMYNWSVLYVHQELRVTQERAALAYVAFAGATAAMRFAGDSVRARVSERAMLVAGPGLSALAMLVVLLVARPWAAMVGFAVVGIGLATIVPILYNAATRVPGVSRAAAIASVSSIGYVGFMVGPPIIGAVAHATTLTIAMGTLIVASVVLMVGARRVPTSDPVPVAEARERYGTLAPREAGN